MFNKIILSLLLLFIYVSPSWAVNAMGWTTAINNNIQAAKNANDPRYLLFKAQVDNNSCSTNNYGLAAAVMYKATGDASYCTKSYNSNGGCVLNSSNYIDPNSSRDCFTDRALAYSLCGGAVDSSTRSAWESQLDGLLLQVRGVSSGSDGTRIVDTDELNGHYFGSIIYCLARDGNLTARCNITNKEGVPWGGVDATSTNQGSTIRNTIAYFWTHHSDGSFVEGSEYNKNTFRYALYGAHAINSFYGVDKFPEITGKIQKIADYHYQHLVPNYSQHWQFGDVQGNQLRWHVPFRTLSQYALMANLSNRADLWDFWDYLYSTNGTSCTQSAWLWHYNPTATRTKQTGTTFFNDNKLGISFWHKGWNTNDTFWVSRQRRYFPADHQYDSGDSIEVWRNNGWVIDIPRHYYGHEDQEQNFLNGLLVYGGYARSREASGQMDSEFGSNYLYHSGVASGLFNGPNEDDRPPAFIDENTSQRLFRYNSNGTEVIFDYHRIRACKPSDTTCMNSWKFDRLGRSLSRAQSRAIAENFKHIKITSAYTSPTKSGDKFSWSAKNGTKVELYTMIDGYEHEIVSLAGKNCQSPNFFCAQGFNESEMVEVGHQLRIKKATVGSYMMYPLLNVISIGDTQPNHTYTKLTNNSSTLDDVIGAMVETSTERVVALFNAENKSVTFTTTVNGGSTGYLTAYDPLRYQKAAKLHRFETGGTVSFSSNNTKNIVVFLTSLDTTKNWTITRNGVPAGCTVSSQGICQFTIPGAAQTHTITWSPSGNLTCDQNCGVCGTENACDNSALTCYWHDNNGSTSSQCFSYDEPTIEDDCNTNCSLCADLNSCEVLSALTCYWHNNNGSTINQCNSYPQPVVTTCDESCSLCLNSTECGASESGCYWHNNDGSTSLQCNAEQARSVKCLSGLHNFCDNSTICGQAGFCWEDSICKPTCTPPPTYKTLVINPSQDVSLDQANPTTNRNTQGLKMRSFVGSGVVELAVDPSTFTLGGANSSTLSASDTTLTHTSLADNGTAYAYKVYSENYFTNFNINFTVRANNQQSNSNLAYFCLSNTINATMATMNANNDGICFGFKREGDDGWFLREYNTGDNNSALAPSDYWVNRWVNISRSGSACTASVYTNSSKTTHASGSPLTVSCGSNPKRYMYLAASNGSDGWASSQGSGYISDVKILTEGAVPTVDLVSLMDFDLSGIPQGSSIVSIQLRGVANDTPIGTGIVYVFKGLRTYLEEQATWNVYTTGNSWTTAGARGSGDYEGNYTTGQYALGKYDIVGTEVNGTTVTFADTQGLKDLVQLNIGGSIKLVLQSRQSNSQAVLSINDSEAPNTSTRPQLIVNYNPPITDPEVPQPYRRKRILSSGFLFGNW
jgi:hypothetical protein